MGKADLFQDPRFNTLAARSAHIDTVYAVLTEGMKARTTEEWLPILRKADIPCGRANSLQDLFDNEYLKETNYFEQHEHEQEGTVTIPAIPARFSQTPANVHRPWPTLGQHTREILAEAGYSEADIDAITAS
jgi:crotonobetainyl-CoA:carnitine CoA-transferase CaiB-like acyl-CoA transferase